MTLQAYSALGAAGPYTALMVVPDPPRMRLNTGRAPYSVSNLPSESYRAPAETVQLSTPTLTAQTQLGYAQAAAALLEGVQALAAGDRRVIREYATELSSDNCSPQLKAAGKAASGQLLLKDAARVMSVLGSGGDDPHVCAVIAAREQFRVSPERTANVHDRILRAMIALGVLRSQMAGRITEGRADPGLQEALRKLDDWICSLGAGKALLHYVVVNDLWQARIIWASSVDWLARQGLAFERAARHQFVTPHADLRRAAGFSGWVSPEVSVRSSSGHLPAGGRRT